MPQIGLNTLIRDARQIYAAIPQKDATGYHTSSESGMSDERVLEILVDQVSRLARTVEVGLARLESHAIASGPTIDPAGKSRPARGH